MSDHVAVGLSVRRELNELRDAVIEERLAEGGQLVHRDIRERRRARCEARDRSRLEPP